MAAIKEGLFVRRDFEGGQMSRDFAYKLKDVYAGKVDLKTLYESHQKEHQNVPAGKQRMRYTTNHDMAMKNLLFRFIKEKKVLSPRL